PAVGHLHRDFHVFHIHGVKNSLHQFFVLPFTDRALVGFQGGTVQMLHDRRIVAGGLLCQFVHIHRIGHPDVRHFQLHSIRKSVTVRKGFVEFFHLSGRNGFHIQLTGFFFSVRTSQERSAVLPCVKLVCAHRFATVRKLRIGKI